MDARYVTRGATTICGFTNAFTGPQAKRVARDLVIVGRISLQSSNHELSTSLKSLAFNTFEKTTAESFSVERCLRGSKNPKIARKSLYGRLVEAITKCC